MIIISNIIAAATLTEQLLCYRSKGLTSINSIIQRLLNVKIIHLQIHYPFNTFYICGEQPYKKEG